jgi:DNA-binding NtrC family response regulator
MAEAAEARPLIRDVLEELIDEMVSKGILWPEALAVFEKLFIERALRECGGNVSKTAQRIGMHRNTLAQKIHLHQIDRR